MEKAAAALLLHLELVAAIIRDGKNLDEQRVIGARGPGIIYRNIAINSLVSAGENKRDLLFDARRTVLFYVNGAVEFGNLIAARPCRQAENQRQEDNQSFPGRKSPATGIMCGFQNFTATFSRSAGVSISKNWRAWKPNIPAIMFVGKDWTRVLKSRTTAL